MGEIRCPGCLQIKENGVVCEHCGWDEQKNNEPHQLPTGTLVKQYQIGKALGQGGFGITYLAWDLYLDTPVAIKEYYPQTLVMRDSASGTNVVCCTGTEQVFRKGRERFLQEAKILAKLGDVPQIVRIHNYFEANDTAYIIMDYLRGDTLKHHFQKHGHTMSMEELIQLIGPVMEAMEQVHAAGLIHRDISPDNIMLMPDGSVRLLDFGAARDVGEVDVDRLLSRSTEAILKHGYAPIEQYRSRGNLGPWTDVHAMCATIVWCLSGEVLPEAPTRILAEKDISIRKLLPDISAAHAQVLTEGLALKASERISSMQELLDRLRNPEKARKKISKILLAVAVLGILTAVGFVIAAPKGNNGAENPGNPIVQVKEEEPLAQNTEAQVSRMWNENMLERDPWFNMLGENPEIDPESIGQMTFLSTPVIRSEIGSVICVDSLEAAPEDAWDVSYAKNGSVLAWISGEEQGLVTLTIGAENGISAEIASAGLFAGCVNLESVRFDDALHLERSDDLSYMFYGCASLTAIPLETMNTSAAVNMNGLFCGCSALKSLPVEMLNTQHVTTMSGMFEGCTGLEELNLKRFHTENVTDMSRMFFGCGNLKSIDISAMDTALVKDMSRMFQNCCNAENIHVGKMETDSVTKMVSMFECCCTMQTLDLSANNGSSSYFRMYNVSNYYRMFAGCTNLRDVKLFAPGGVFLWNADTTYFFQDCPNLSYATKQMFRQ